MFECLFSILFQWIVQCESAYRHFQQGEGPYRSLLRDCENFAEGSFWALDHTMIDHAAAQLLQLTATAARQKLE